MNKWNIKWKLFTAMMESHMEHAVETRIISRFVGLKRVRGIRGCFDQRLECAINRDHKNLPFGLASRSMQQW